MSPLVAEQSAEKTAGRGRRWPLYLALCLLGLLLFIPLAPVLYPVRWQLGNVWVLVGTTRISEDSLLPKPGIHRLDQVRDELEDPQGVRYQVDGGVHAATVRVSNWIYYVLWFKGSRAR